MCRFLNRFYPRSEVLVEGFHGESHLGALMRTVTDRSPRLCKQVQFIAEGIIDAGVAAGNRHVTERRAWPKDAGAGEILHHRFTISVQESSRNSRKLPPAWI